MKKNKLIIVLLIILTCESYNVYAGNFEKDIVKLKEKIKRNPIFEKATYEVVNLTTTKGVSFRNDYKYIISPTYDYIAILTLGEAGATILSITDVKGENRIVCDNKDVEPERVVWHSKKNILYYAGSPIYGTPGIYEWDIESNKKTQIVKPEIKNKAFPEGFDYFILLSISPDNRYLFYYRSAEKQQFNIQTIKNLYYVDLKSKKCYKILK